MEVFTDILSINIFAHLKQIWTFTKSFTFAVYYLVGLGVLGLYMITVLILSTQLKLFKIPDDCVFYGFCGGVTVTEKRGPKRTRGQTTVDADVLIVTATDDETGRSRRFIQDLPHDQTQHYTTVTDYVDWEEFAEQMPRVEPLLVSAPTTPTSSPSASRPDTPVTSAATQEQVANILEQMYENANMQEMPEAVLDEYDIGGEYGTSHVTRRLRYLYDARGQQSHIDVVEVATNVLNSTDADEVNRLRQHLSKVTNHLAHLPDFEYNHQLRVEVEYEGGKRDTYHNLHQWLKTMEAWWNEYADELHIRMPKAKRITVTLCGSDDYQTLRTAGYKVRGSHGFPSMIVGTQLVRMDLFKTNGTCAAAAYFTYWALTRRLASGVSIFESWRTYTDAEAEWIRFKQLCRHRGISTQWATDDFALICKAMGSLTPKLVQYFEHDEQHMQQLATLTATDFTTGTCHLLISKSMHASVIWPMQLLSHNWTTAITLKMNRTYDRVIHSTPKPNKIEPYAHINTLDIESLVLESGVHVPQLLCFVYEDMCYGFACSQPVELFIQWVMQQGKSMEFWCHNLSYDGAFFNGVMLRYCNNKLHQPVRVFSNAKGIIKCKYHLTNGKVLTLRDSYAHLPDSLDNLGKAFTGRGKMAYDVTKLKTPASFWTRDCISYCINDCALLQQVLLIYQATTITTHNLNPLRYTTISSYAKNSALYSVSATGTRLYTLAPAVDEYLRKGYHGGRTEALHTGTHSEQMQLLDFNSHYPAMMTQDLPCGKPRYRSPDECSNISSDAQADWLVRNRGFYTIHVLDSPPHLKYHLFGSVDGHGRYTFTDATNQTYYAEESDTIIYALTLGYRLRLLEGYSFKYTPYMHNWVERHYQDKVDATVAGDAVRRIVAKYILNSAYGAFGTKWKERKQHAVYGERCYKQLHNNSLLGYNSGTTINNIWAGTETTDLLLTDVNVAISSCTTSRGRLKLHQTMMQMDSLACEVLYVDTDSLIVQPKDPTVTSSLIHPTQLGALKLEAQLTQLTLLAPKAYSYTTVDGKVVSKLKGLNLSQCTPTPNVPQLLSDTLTGTSTTVHTTKLFRPKSLFFTPTPIISKLLKYTLTCK